MTISYYYGADVRVTQTGLGLSKRIFKRRKSSDVEKFRLALRMP
jgi:hypothetical protein